MTAVAADDGRVTDHSDRVDVLTALPTAHAVLIRLERSGATHEQMAVALGVSVASIPTLLHVAWGKYHELEGRG